MTPEEEQRQRQQQGGGGLNIPALIAGNYLFGGGETPALSSLPSFVEGGMSSVPAGAAMPEGFSAVGSAADGGTLVGPSSLAEPGLGTLGTVASGLAALHGGYNLAKNFGKGNAASGAMSGAEAGAGIGSFILPGAGTLAGAGIGAIAGGLLGAVKNGKHADQINRDKVREVLKSGGLVDDQYNVTLADGSKFNIGVDGGARPEYGFSGGRRPYEVKEESPLSGDAVGWANPIAQVITGGDPKLSSDFAGYLANAAMSNAATPEGVRANILSIMQNFKLDRATLENGIKALNVPPDKKAAYLNGIATLFAGDSKRYVNKSVAQMRPEVEAQNKAVSTSTPPTSTAPPGAVTSPPMGNQGPLTVTPATPPISAGSPPIVQKIANLKLPSSSPVAQSANVGVPNPTSAPVVNPPIATPPTPPVDPNAAPIYSKITNALWGPRQMGNAVPGYAGAKPEAQSKVTDSAKAAQALISYGDGGADKGQQINWARYLTPGFFNRGEGSAPLWDNSKTPTEEDIQKANWLKASKKAELIDIVKNIQNLTKAQTATQTGR